MTMQTGPAPKQSLDCWLIWTGLLEIANTVIFTLLWSQVNRLLPGREDILSLAGLTTLNVILIEGGLYWLLVRVRFFQRSPIRVRYHLIQALYLFSVLLLLVFPGLLGLGAYGLWALELPDFLLGLGFYLFGVGEFIHYFIFKINMRAAERSLATQNHQWIEARLLRELRRARQEMGQK